MKKIKEGIMIVLACGIFLMITNLGKAEENKVQFGDSGKLWAMAFGGEFTDDLERLKAAVNINEPNNKVTVFVKNEWEDIKHYQRTNWHQGKMQMQKNKESIGNFFKTLADAVSKATGAQ